MRIKRFFCVFSLLLIFLIGCSLQNDSANEDNSMMLPEKYEYDGTEIITYKNLVTGNSEKSLSEENIDDLNIIIYSRFEEGEDYIIFDFSNGYVFNQSSYVANVSRAVRPADEELKSEIIAKLKDYNAEGWWGDTYDVNSEEIQGWYNRTEYSHVWRLYFQFKNGEVITLYGVGYSGSDYGPDELNDFLHYLLSLTEI